MDWEIGANLGRGSRVGVKARGWLWQITRGDRLRPLLIEISASAQSTDPVQVPDDTRRALEMGGRTELLPAGDRERRALLRLTRKGYI
jgi:hypothetical protein